MTKCKKHPEYTGTRLPVIGCHQCWVIYTKDERRNKMPLKTVIIHGKPARPDEPSPRVGREHAELWVGYAATCTDWTRRFDPHPVEHAPHYHDGIKGKRPEVWEYYKRLVPDGRKLYLLEAHPEVPASEAYPLEMVRNRIGRPGTQRLTTTVDLQMALALAEGFEHIILHNVGLITDDWNTTGLNPEWADRHKGILYWIGVAEYFGEYEPVKVTIEGDSIFAVPEKLYGYETCGRDYGVRQRRYFTGR